MNDLTELQFFISKIYRVNVKTFRSIIERFSKDGNKVRLKGIKKND